MATKQLKLREFNHSRGDIYYCLTFDVTEEIREMFGVPIKEAFAVYKSTAKDMAHYEKDFWDNPPKTLEVLSRRFPNGITVKADDVQIPDMNEIYVVFDDTHTVCFWTSEWGGMKATDLKNIDFGG